VAKRRALANEVRAEPRRFTRKDYTNRRRAREAGTERDRPRHGGGDFEQTS